MDADVADQLLGVHVVNNVCLIGGDRELDLDQ